MPTYQYACTQCDERLEAVQGFTDAPLTTCPVCEGRLRKVFSAVGVVFKGSGFYKNDSRGAEKRRDGNGEGGGDKGSDKADNGGVKADKSEKADKAGDASRSGDKGSGKGGDGAGSPKPAGDAPKKESAPAAGKGNGQSARTPSAKSA